jgi:hypothetical protein
MTEAAVPVHLNVYVDHHQNNGFAAIATTTGAGHGT